MQEATATTRTATRPRRPAAAPAGLTVPDPRRVAPRLLAWYRRTARDLPWRRSSDAYRVWLSEVMLQQTQVERVQDYFRRFLARFPTVASLARADEPEVLRLWEGLGYYRRARQLHAAARAVVREHGGRFPDSVAALRTLPGVGRYTAAAVASIAFGRPEPIVEANSRRVLARLAGHTGSLAGPRREEPLWQLAASLLPRRAAGRFNQALMDLGALVCTPRRPLCDRCPLAACCAARRDGTAEAIPARTARRETLVVRERAVVYRRGDRVLLERRGPGSWWEGMWDFPRRTRGRTSGSHLGSLTYTVTHHRVTCDVVSADPRTAPRGDGLRWVAIRSLETLPLSAPGRRIARLLAAR